jgi:3-oxoacyl-[acyl-carrier-protein] synthase II
MTPTSTPDPRDVVLTGIGPVTPIGTGVEDFWQGLLARQSAVRTITRFDATPFRTHVAAEIAHFDPADYVDAKRARRLDRFSGLTLAACRLALQDAVLDPHAVAPSRGGVFLGTALGGVAKGEEEHTAFLHGGVRDVDPAVALSVFPGAGSCNVAIETGWTGPNVTNGMSCASGAMALGEAMHAIRRGDCDVALAGGSEASLAPLCFGAFAIIRAMSQRNDDPATASRPFDADRDGFVMAEGAAMFVLESRAHAEARGARIHAQLSGYGTTNDAHHMTAPRPDGAEAARAIRLALGDAQLGPDEVEYVNAHGSSTSLNDVTEALALSHVFGERLARLPVSGTKGYHAHALGASGAFEAAVVALAMTRGWLPPCLNLSTVDPGCTGLDLIRGDGRAARPRVVLSNSFGFGGINAALVFRAAE